MAQKTPASALTIALSGTWTSLWYYEFTDVQTLWTSNLQLHYLVGAYFALKRRLVHNFAVVQSNQLIYLNAQLVTLTRSKKRVIYNKKKLLVKAKRFSRRVNYSNKQTRNTKLLIRSGNIKKKVYSTLFFSNLRNKLIKKNKHWLSLKNWRLPQQTLSTSLKKNYSQTNLFNIIKGRKKRRNRSGKRFMSTFLPSTVVGATLNKSLKYTNNVLTNLNLTRKYIIQTKVKKLVKKPMEYEHILLDPNYAYLNYSYENLLAINHKVLGLSLLTSILIKQWRNDWKNYKRLRPRQTKTQRGFVLSQKLLHAYRHKANTTKNRYARHFLKLSLLRQACQHVTGFQVRLNIRRFNCFMGALTSLKGRAVFSRWSRQSYFLPTVSLVLISLMRGSCLLLMNWLLRLLKAAKKHSSILYLVSAALKYFLHEPDSGRLIEALPCAGARLEVVGKVDGQDRAKTFRFQIGAIPTSTLSAPLDTEYAVCGTIYGVLGITLWYFMKPTNLPSQTILADQRFKIK